MARTPQLFMQPGDVVEVQVSGIGTLRNTIRAESSKAGSTDARSVQSVPIA
jgi:hypothetical protein